LGTRAIRLHRRLAEEETLKGRDGENKKSKKENGVKKKGGKTFGLEKRNKDSFACHGGEKKKGLTKKSRDRPWSGSKEAGKREKEAKYRRPHKIEKPVI